MIKNEINNIKELIKDKYDIELISLEFDISIEKLKQYKKEIETTTERDNKKEQPKGIIRGVNTNKEDKHVHKDLEEMRRRYKKLFFQKDTTVESKTVTKLSQQENELVNSEIIIIENKIQEIKSISNKEKIETYKDIADEIKKISKIRLTTEQAEKLYHLMDSKELKKIKTQKGEIKKNIYRQKKQFLKKLVAAIELELSQTEDIEKLRYLNKKLTLNMSKENPAVVSTIDIKIRNKIQKLLIINRTRIDIPTNIISIIEELANGTLNTEEANEIIEQEARKSVESKPKTRFTLTVEQERRKILTSIRNRLIEQSKKYQIRNPKITVLQMQELDGGELDVDIQTVVKNLISAKDFEKAKEFCDIVVKEQKTLYRSIKILKKEIKNAEISDLVLKGINMNGTVEEERKYFELLEEGLNRGEVDLEAVSLGKSQDGLRNITLADIWQNENLKGIYK